MCGSNNNFACDRKFEPEINKKHSVENENEKSKKINHFYAKYKDHLKIRRLSFSFAWMLINETLKEKKRRSIYNLRCRHRCS